MGPGMVDDRSNHVCFPVDEIARWRCMLCRETLQRTLSMGPKEFSMGTGYQRVVLWFPSVQSRSRHYLHVRTKKGKRVLVYLASHIVRRKSAYLFRGG